MEKLADLYSIYMGHLALTRSIFGYQIIETSLLDGQELTVDIIARLKMLPIMSVKKTSNVVTKFNECDVIFRRAHFVYLIT